MNKELRKEIDNAIQQLLMRDTPTSVQNADEKFGCAPVRDFYISFVSKYHIPFLKDVWGFVPYEDYPTTETAKDSSEIGSIGNVRFFYMPLVPKTNEIIIQSFNEDFMCVDNQKVIIKKS